MARTVRIERRIASFDTGGTPVRHEVNLLPIFPGETLTRVRWQFWIGQFQGAIPFAADGVQFGVALQVYAPAEIPVQRFPVTDPNDDWLWWEGVTMRSDVFALRSDGSEINEMRGPIGDGIRDSKAQRGPITGVDAHFLFLQTQASVTAQGGHFLSYAVSAIILEAA